MPSSGATAPSTDPLSLSVIIRLAALSLVVARFSPADSPLLASGRRECALIERTGFERNQRTACKPSNEESMETPAQRLQVRAMSGSGEFSTPANFVRSINAKNPLA